MIDYKKLEEAIRLCNDLPGWYFSIDFSTCLYGDEYIISLVNAREVRNDDEGVSCTLDELILILKELSKPKSNAKYTISQKVWFLNNHCELCCFIIHSVYKDCKILYKDQNSHWWPEELLYPSKLALIDAQIKHWTDLKEDNTNA